jgi:regulator of protease activity HflC (stomatin/prohibitin superfamily)
MEAEAEIPEEAKPPRMNRRQWKAARGNREDKWTRKDRLLREANAEKNREQMAAEAAADAEAAEANKEDPEAAIATRYRASWIQIFSRFHGSYEDTSKHRLHGSSVLLSRDPRPFLSADFLFDLEVSIFPVIGHG